MKSMNETPFSENLLEKNYCTGKIKVRKKIAQKDVHWVKRAKDEGGVERFCLLGFAGILYYWFW